MSATRPVWIDGRLRAGAEACLSIHDRGARDGEGLLETVRVYRGRPFLWERHLERLVLSAAELGFPVPPGPAALRAALDAVLAAGGLDEAAARLTITRGVPGGRPTRAGAWVEAEPIEARRWPGARRGRASAIVSRRPFAPGPLGRHKTTSRLAYHLAREEARAVRADEAILVSAAGEVLEGATSSLFAVIEDRIVTPPLDSGILPGITRAWVIEACAAAGAPVVERPVSLEELRAAAEVFLANALQEVVALAALDGRTLPSRERGSDLAERYRRAAAVGAPPAAEADPPHTAARKSPPAR